MRSIILALTLFLSVPASAFAQPVTWMFTGITTLTTSPDPAFLAQFPVGLPVSLRVTYNPAAPELTQSNISPGNPTIGHYFLSNNPVAGVTFVDVESRIGPRRWHLGGWPEIIYVRALQGRFENDGILTEKVKGELVSTTVTWKPHYQMWDVRWPGVVFASDALPDTLPNPHPAGSMELNFFTCANHFADPCPGGIQLRSRINIRLTNARRVHTQRIDVKPGDPVNQIDRTTRATPVAILGNHAFQPAVQVDRSTIELSKAPVHTSNGQPACSTSDVNNDGHLDLVCHVRTELIAPREHENNTARLIAMTTDGNYIQGSHRIQFIN